MRILVVEDDDRVAGALQSALLLRGYEVARAQTGAAALEACAARSDLDLVLLDLGLPDCDGMVVAAELRAGSIAVIVVTARADVMSQVVALRGGADDFVVKPFSTDALMARIEAVLRRTQRTPAPPAAVMQVGELRVDPAAQIATLADGRIALTRIEFAILEQLARANGAVVGHQRMLLAVWGTDWRGTQHSSRSSSDASSGSSPSATSTSSRNCTSRCVAVPPPLRSPPSVGPR